MADAYVTGVTPTASGEVVGRFADMLIAAGWTASMSTDGLSGTFSAGYVFTGYGSGSGKWGNNGAGIVLRDPAGVREILIRFMLFLNARNQVHIMYSPAAHFGLASSPSATDQISLSVYPNLDTVDFNSGGGTKYYGKASGTAPYGFWFAGAATPGGGGNSCFIMDPVVGIDDTDPVVFITSNALVNRRLFYLEFNTTYDDMGARCFQGSSGTQTTCGLVGAFTVTRGGGQGKLYPTVTACALTFANGMNGNQLHLADTGGVQNPFDSSFDALPVFYHRPSATLSFTTIGGYIVPSYVKGHSTLLRWTGVARTNFVDTANSKAWICVGNVWLPWDGVTTPTA